MPDDTCIEDGCDKPVHIKRWQLCQRCYARSWRAGRLGRAGVGTAGKRHTLTNVDEVTRTATCAKCGPVNVIAHHRRWVCRQNARAWRDSYRHGLTEAQIDALLDAADHACQGCRRPFTTETPFCVDHDHACCPGQRSCGLCARGLLCRGCNVALGMVRDEPEVLRTLAAYLEAALEKLPIQEKLPFQ